MLKTITIMLLVGAGVTAQAEDPPVTVPAGIFHVVGSAYEMGINTEEEEGVLILQAIKDAKTKADATCGGLAFRKTPITLSTGHICGKTFLVDASADYECHF